MSSYLRSLVVAVSMCLASTAFAGIANTKHNLGTSAGNPGSNKTSDGTAEICVFCHTPHASDTSAPVPLWNKKINTGTSYTTYASMNSSSIDGEILPVGSISLACLSCHDGTQAMDNIINAPGSGGYDATGGGTNGFGWTWGGNVSTEGKLGAGVSNIGTDLQNDHPIGIEYCGGGITGSGTSVSGTCTDADFKAPVTKLVNGNQVFWVDVNTDGVRQKTDIALYSRTFTGGTIRPSVECASCHDPHVEPKNSGEVNFMRVATAGSAICLACHVK